MSFIEMEHICTLLPIILCLVITHLSVTSYIPEFRPDYQLALKYSLLFYESQRSGKLPASNRIRWRGDSALDDRGLNGEDLSGGYYDASDFVKFGFTMAFTTTLLSWSVISYKDAYVNTGQYNDVLHAIQWATDYFIKCHPRPNEFYGQVGDFSIDHAFWGRPEDMNMPRPAYKIDTEHPGSDLAGESAAVFSSASIVFQNVNGRYSKELLRHAKELYNFAKNYTGLYQEVIPGAKEYYESKSYGDELTWAAIWLFKATKNKKYLVEAEEFYKKFDLSQEKPNEFSYNKKVAGIEVLLGEVTGNTTYVESVRQFCDNAVDIQQRTPKGLIFIDKFGTLSHAANIAFICLKAAEFPDFPKQKYIAFAKQQIDYILGSSGRSYVVGYGHDFPKKPFHSASSCPNMPAPCGWAQFNSTSSNPQILYGALVSGPDQNDYYQDIREEFLYNEVNLDYNAGFQSTLAGLIHYHLTNEIKHGF